MRHPNKLFLLSVMVAGGVFVRPLVAAPTVKTFGNTTGTNAYGTVRGTIAKAATSTPRAASARAVGMPIKSVTKSNTKSVGTTQNTTTTATDSMRAPGMHGNIIKGISSKLSSNYTSSTGGGSMSDLTQRVVNLEQDINTKQEALNAGDGISIDGDVISISQDIATLPDKVDEMSQEIDELSQRVDDMGLSDNYYTIQQTQDYVQDHYYTKEYVDQIVNQLTNKNVAVEFDPTFLTKGQ